MWKCCLWHIFFSISLACIKESTVCLWWFNYWKNFELWYLHRRLRFKSNLQCVPILFTLYGSVWFLFPTLEMKMLKFYFIAFLLSCNQNVFLDLYWHLVGCSINWKSRFLSYKCHCKNAINHLICRPKCLIIVGLLR